jgi:sigma-B regulation protein RsbU (phosphoserine phosphatase)
MRTLLRAWLPRNDRAAWAGALTAAGWLVVVTAGNLVLPHDVVPDPLYVLAPLAACAVLSARATAGFGVVAVCLTVWSGWWNHLWGATQQWVRLLDVVLVGAAAVVIATVRVRREHRFARMVNIAETAQRAILPTLPTAAAGVGIAGRYVSAAEDAVVGGDLFDCSVTEGYTRFIVGDVRGKGIAAVEQAARVIRAFRQSAATQPELADVVVGIDSYLTPFLGDEEFVTAILVDMVSAERVRLVSCGHPPAVLIRADGTAELVEVDPGLPLGIGHEPEPRTVGWAQGDRLLLYTDGASEARDATGAFFPLLERAPMLSGGTIEEALDRLLGELRRHVVDGRLGDDLAVVMLENTAATSGADQGGTAVEVSVPLVGLR